jgi:hypothetical protein
LTLPLLSYRIGRKKVMLLSVIGALARAMTLIAAKQFGIAYTLYMPIGPALLWPPGVSLPSGDCSWPRPSFSQSVF